MSLGIIRRQILDKLNTITGLYPTEVGQIAGKVIPVCVVNDSAAPVETQVSVTSGFAKGTATQTLIQKSNGKAGTAVVAGTGVNLYTVTASKTLYITRLSVTCDAITTWQIADGAVGNTPVDSGRVAANSPEVHIFPSPLKIITNVFFDVGTGGTENVSFNGWEE